MKPYRYAIFDLDGTLLNTADDLADSVNFALQESGFPERSLDEIKRFIGNGVERLVRLSLGKNTSEDQFQAVFSAFRAHYAQNMNNKTGPYPGIVDLLRALTEKGVGISVASNKYQKGVEQLCGIYFQNLYTLALGEREGIARKPDPSIVFAALRAMHAKKEQTLYIGDSEVDGETAKNAGVDFLGVSWGLRKKKILTDGGAIGVADAAAEILRYF